MKAKSFLGTIAIMAVTVVSCVKSEYDDKNRSNEINVLPGVSVNVGKNLNDITPGSLFNAGGSSIGVDSQGNYQIVGTARNGGFRENIMCDPFDSGETARFESGLELEFSNLPEFLADNSFNGSLAAPVLNIYVDNVTGSEAVFSCSARAGSKVVLIDNIVVPSGRQVITVENDEFKSLFDDGVPASIKLVDLQLRKNATDTKASYSADSSSSDAYAVGVDAGCVIPMSFDANSVAVFNYLVDFSKESLSINSLEGIKVGVKTIEFTGTVWNEIPLSVKLSAVGLDANENVFTKDVIFSYTDRNDKPVSGILAGAPGEGTETNFTLTIKSDSDLINMSNIQAVIEATNATNDVVSLNEGQIIKFHINDATFGDGINVN